MAAGRVLTTLAPSSSHRVEFSHCSLTHERPSLLLSVANKPGKSCPLVGRAEEHLACREEAGVSFFIKSRKENHMAPSPSRLAHWLDEEPLDPALRSTHQPRGQSWGSQVCRVWAKFPGRECSRDGATMFLNYKLRVKSAIRYYPSGQDGTAHGTCRGNPLLLGDCA